MPLAFLIRAIPRHRSLEGEALRLHLTLPAAGTAAQALVPEAQVPAVPAARVEVAAFRKQEIPGVARGFQEEGASAVAASAYRRLAHLARLAPRRVRLPLRRRLPSRLSHRLLARHQARPQRKSIRCRCHRPGQLQL